MSKERELLKKLLDSITELDYRQGLDPLTCEIEELLDQPEQEPEFGDGPEFDGWEKRSGNSLMQEPVAWMNNDFEFYANEEKYVGNLIPLYTSPPKQELIDLDQVDKHLKTCDLSEDYRDGYIDGIIFAEREHKIRGKYE